MTCEDCVKGKQSEMSNLMSHNIRKNKPKKSVCGNESGDEMVAADDDMEPFEGFEENDCGGDLRDDNSDGDNGDTFHGIVNDTYARGSRREN